MPSPDRVASRLRRRGFEVRVVGASRLLAEAVDLEVLAGGEHVAYVRVFEGRRRHYRGWVEAYAVNWRDRRLVEALVEALASSLGPGERLMIEYAGSGELERALQYLEPEETWLGRLLLSLGLTGLRDLYYPEGFMEGGPKLAAEKPLRR